MFFSILPCMLTILWTMLEDKQFWMPDKPGVRRHKLKLSPSSRRPPACSAFWLEAPALFGCCRSSLHPAIHMSFINLLYSNKIHTEFCYKKKRLRSSSALFPPSKNCGILQECNIFHKHLIKCTQNWRNQQTTNTCSWMLINWLQLIGNDKPYGHAYQRLPRACLQLPPFPDLSLYSLAFLWHSNSPCTNTGLHPH